MLKQLNNVYLKEVQFFSWFFYLTCEIARRIAYKLYQGSATLMSTAKNVIKIAFNKLFELISSLINKASNSLKQLMETIFQLTIVIVSKFFNFVFIALKFIAISFTSLIIANFRTAFVKAPRHLMAIMRKYFNFGKKV